jgi:hypothetical protein
MATKQRSVWVVEIQWKKSQRGPFATDKWMLDLGYPKAHDNYHEACAYRNQIPMEDAFNYRLTRYDASK